MQHAQGCTYASCESQNDIKYAPTECRHEGDCAGTCPKCESEMRWLERQLKLRQQLGKAVVVVGVGMGLAALTARPATWW